ncbi:MFS transporter [Alysiella filiformis]|uniref:Predicted arabinose efflux permease, MFS family n=1 Tax=Alysiella filiformis DSM 16848 TaxID=1120981 RepID=A0A286EED1_9NEIS|nr:MFS transporter [Alysiella filiformis]QMT31616.1 MFS transporter [Alysiella filiformis]UBQ55373.1 MFS transporter [Alysiella filiformis DSM 16848]SOD69261.1 Predicted arabinose efflux permease, MFS family [Alysiella filiformis DSM 16848]
MNPRLSPALLLTIGLISITAFVQVYSVQAILPVLMGDLRASEVQAGWAVGATILSIALLSPFIGLLSDAWGRKRLIASALFLLAIPTLALAWVNQIETMIALRFLQGLAVPACTVVLIAYIGEEFSGSQMAKLMSWYVSGTVLGGFLGRFVVGHVDAWLSWRWGFALLAGLCVLSGACVWRYLPESRHFVANTHIQAGLNTLRSHLHNKRLLAACVLGACVLFSLVGCFTYVNLHLAAEPYRLNSGQLANIFTVYLIGMVITPLSARLIARLGNRHTIVLAMSLSALGVIGSLQSPLWAIMVALILMSSGVFVTQSATISYIASRIQTGRSLATGLYYMAYYGGGTVGAWLCGWAYQYGSWQAVVATLLGIQLLGMATAWWGMAESRS